MSGLYCWTGDHLKWVGNATPLIVLEQTLRCYCGQLKKRRKPSDWTPPLPHFVPVHSDGLRVEDRNEIVNENGTCHYKWDVRREVAGGSGPELGLIEGRAFRLRVSAGFLQLWT